MKQLAQKPLFLSLLLAVVLWFVFENFVVALAIGLLTGFLISMLHSLRVLKQQGAAERLTPQRIEPPLPSSTAATEPKMSKPHSNAQLLSPEATEQAHLVRVQQHLRQAISNSPGQFLPFEQWMQLALYAPGLGYYAAGSQKFGTTPLTGDFTTAPELSPLFGQALARQVAQVLKTTQTVHVLEFGAGSGALAAALIPALRTLGIEPVYQILEVSADLKDRQQSRLAELNAKIEWLDQLPHAFSGCVIANEVLDAMPVHLFEWGQTELLFEVGITYDQTFQWATRPASPRLQKIVGDRMPPMPGYRSELNLLAESWVTGLGNWLHKGVALLIDYGFPRREYYHPQRAEGTLMCHYRHHAHANALMYPGLQDITAHVDFTAMADAALEGGLDVMGYTTQARFLINCGIADLIAKIDATDPVEHARQVGPIQKLLSEAEMGELFKVLAVGQGVDGPLLGFTIGDRRDRL